MDDIATSASPVIAPAAPVRRRLLPGLLLALLSLTVTLLVLELGVRAMHLAPPAESPGWFWKVPDPQTGWALQPSAAGRWFNPRYEYDVPITINSQGLRDVERSGYAKPANTFRILLLGDSYVEGLRVPLEQTFGKVLERELNAAAPAGLRFEVVSAGVSGWGTDQELLWLRNEGLKYQPDLVLLAFFPGNDFQNNSEALEAANMGSVQKPFFHLEGGRLALRYYPFDPAQAAQAANLQPKRGASLAAEQVEDQGQAASNPASPTHLPLARWRPWLHDHLATYRLLAALLPDAAPALAGRLASWGLIERGQAIAAAELRATTIPVAYGVYQQAPSSEWRESFVLTGALLQEMQSAVKAAGGRLALVNLTGREQVYPELWQKALQKNPAMQPLQWDLEQPNRVVQGLAAEAGIPFLDLLPIFRQQAQAGTQPLHMAHDGHWTPAGEQLAGQAIYQFLLQQGLAPQRQPLSRQDREEWRT